VTLADIVALLAVIRKGARLTTGFVVAAVGPQTLLLVA
jgi:hypothetical protein